MYIPFFILKQKDNKHLTDSFWSLNKIAFEKNVAQCLVVLKSFVTILFGRSHAYLFLISISVWCRSLVLILYTGLII